MPHFLNYPSLIFFCFWLTPTPLHAPTTSLSRLFTEVWIHLPCTCSYYLNLAFFILSTIEATLTFSRITSFRILSLLVYPYIHLNIPISATCIFCHAHAERARKKKRSVKEKQPREVWKKNNRAHSLRFLGSKQCTLS